MNEAKPFVTALIVEICPFSQSFEKNFLYLKVSIIPHRVPATIKKRSTATASIINILLIIPVTCIVTIGLHPKVFWFDHISYTTTCTIFFSSVNYAKMNKCFSVK